MRIDSRREVLLKHEFQREFLSFFLGLMAISSLDREKNLMFNGPWTCVKQKPLNLTNFKFWVVHFQEPRLHMMFFLSNDDKELSHLSSMGLGEYNTCIQNDQWLFVRGVIQTANQHCQYLQIITREFCEYSWRCVII